MTPGTAPSPEPDKLPSTRDVPLFTNRGDGNAVWAQFPSGKSLVAERTRARNYPGLASPAPPTAALYRLLASRMPAGCRVLDAGCGTGTGLPELLDRFERVVALDRNIAAIEFAHQYCSSAEFVRADLQVRCELGRFDSIFVVDVLGHLAQPFSALRRLYALLADGGRIAVCEPTAFPSQSLRAPARRAFSKKSLTSLLGAAGFQVEEWALASGTFLGCVASRQTEDGHASLAEATSAVASSDAAAAIEAYERASTSSARAVQLEAAIGLAELYVACNQGDAASRCWMLARKLDTTDPRPLAGLAQLNLAIGDASQAIELARMALTLDPTDAGAVCVAAQAAESLEPGSASPFWRRACNLLPDNIAVAAGYARTASAAGDQESAIHALERVRQYDDNDALSVHVELARTLALAGRLADARLEFSVAHALAPEHPDVELLALQLAPSSSPSAIAP